MWFKENMWPMVVWKTVHYLVHNSLQIETTWLESMNSINNENRESVTPGMYNEV